MVSPKSLEPGRRPWVKETMHHTTRSRLINIAFVAFFIWSSFASLDGFALCTAEGHGFGTVAAHPPHMVCMTPTDGDCCHDAGRDAEIAHHHVPCSGIPLPPSLGHVQEPDRLPGLMLLWASSLPVQGAGTCFANDAETGLRWISGADSAPILPLHYIESVVLII